MRFNYSEKSGLKYQKLKIIFEAKNFLLNNNYSEI